ncbi:MAG: hypothetical protein O3C27_03180 [Actinomycetota bacterium]|nr:hypothetical protein [Actinomycetota bacterium]
MIHSVAVHAVRVSRASAILVSAAVLLSACTSDSVGEVGIADEVNTLESASTTTTVATTTTVPPIFLGVSPNLDLIANECFADLPTPTSVVTTEPDEGAEPDADNQPTLDTEPTVPDTLPVTTIIPAPPMLALVDCNGSNLGQVFATFCVGQKPEATPGQLTAIVCPGDPDLEYPSDRSLRRTAARICVQRFEETFKQPYSLSTRVGQEFVPTEGVWNRGDRRVVCHSIEPPPPTTTTERLAE